MIRQFFNRFHPKNLNPFGLQLQDQGVTVNQPHFPFSDTLKNKFLQTLQSESGSESQNDFDFESDFESLFFSSKCIADFGFEETPAPKPTQEIKVNSKSKSPDYRNDIHSPLDSDGDFDALFTKQFSKIDPFLSIQPVKDNLLPENSLDTLSLEPQQQQPPELKPGPERITIETMLGRDLESTPSLHESDISVNISKTQLKFFQNMFIDAQIDIIAKCRNESEFPDVRSKIPEIAFCGRSNVGKSSLINLILGLTSTKQILSTSSKPGKTQSIDFVNVDNRFHLVDLPGYGFAKAPKEVVDNWNELIGTYLLNRPTLRRVFLLIDSRIGLQPIDMDFMDLLESSGVPFQILLTKTDSATKTELSESLDSIRANQMMIDGTAKQKTLAYYLFKHSNKVSLSLEDFHYLTRNTTTKPNFQKTLSKGSKIKHVHPARASHKSAKKKIQKLLANLGLSPNFFETHGGGSYGLETIKQHPLTVDSIDFFTKNGYFTPLNFLPRISFYPHVIKSSIKSKLGLSLLRQTIGIVCIGSSTTKFNPIVPKDRELADQIAEAKSLMGISTSTNLDSDSDQLPPPPVPLSVQRAQARKKQRNMIKAKKAAQAAQKSKRAMNSSEASKFKRKLREKRKVSTNKRISKVGK